MFFELSKVFLEHFEVFFDLIKVFFGLFKGFFAALLGVEQAWTPILYLTDFLCKSLALPRDLSTYLVIISFEPSLVEVNQAIKAWSF